MHLEAAVLKGDGAKVFRFVCTGLFWQQDDVGFVDGA
jgi:hypothetical protein